MYEILTISNENTENITKFILRTKILKMHFNENVIHTYKQTNDVLVNSSQSEILILDLFHKLRLNT